MFDRLRRTQKIEAEPNLIPVMNLFVAMIPFLLLAVAFFQIGVIPATLPTHTENTSDVEPVRDAVTVSLVVNQQGFSITALNQVLSDAELATLAREIPREGEQYNYEELSELLRSIKRRFPGSDTIIVLPTERISYGEVVRVMDAVRYVIESDAGQDRRVPLFPNIVLSRTVPA